MTVNLMTSLRTRECSGEESRRLSPRVVLETYLEGFWRAMVLSACWTLKELGSGGSNGFLVDFVLICFVLPFVFDL